jgi:creatinine amidohydrolase
MKSILLAILLTITLTGIAQKSNPKNKAIFLENISWTSAKEILTTDAVVVIPLGGGAKEHGPHLPLSTDLIQADGIRDFLALERKVIIAPTISYGFYPAFIKYPGSTTLSYTTSTEMILQIIRSLSNYGPKRFYIINIGVSTTPSLETAAGVLADEGILLYFSNYSRPNFKKTEAQFRTKELGGHADEIETSNVLSLRPDLVDMKKAVNDSSAKGKQGMILSPDDVENAAYSPSGIVGYAALGSSQKGSLSLNAFTKVVISEIDSIATCAIPKEKNRQSEYKQYEGEYTGAGRKNIIIQIKENHLQYKFTDANFFSPYLLFRNAEDYFSALNLNILFVKNETGQIVKVWCQNKGESFWLTKLK